MAAANTGAAAAAFAFGSPAQVGASEGRAARAPKEAEAAHAPSGAAVAATAALLLAGAALLRFPAIAAYRGIVAVPLVLVAWTAALMILLSPGVLGLARFSSPWAPAASALLLGLAVLWLLCRFWAPLTGLRDVAAPPRAALRCPPEVTLLTWNVYLRCAAAERWHSNDRKERRVPDIARIAAGSGADVLCLQEACGTLNFRAHRLRDLLRARGYRYALLPRLGARARPAQVVDDGLCLFSRLPMRALRRGTFAAARGPDAFMAKGYQVAEVGTVASPRGGEEAGRASERKASPEGAEPRSGGEAEGGRGRVAAEGPGAAAAAAVPLRVANLHLQSSYTLEPSRRDVAARRAQLAQFLREAGADMRAGPAAVAGDLNVNAWRYPPQSAGAGASEPPSPSARRPALPGPAPPRSLRAEDGRGDPGAEYAATLAAALGAEGFADAHRALPLPPRTQTCAYGPDAPHERHTCFYPPRPGDVVAPRTLDYIWHARTSLAVAAEPSPRLVPSRGASDHHALVATLRRRI